MSELLLIELDLANALLKLVLLSGDLRDLGLLLSVLGLELREFLAGLLEILSAGL